MVEFVGISVITNILTLVIHSTNGFNFSPKPNLVFREPSLKTFMPKVRSSYFGLAINLRKSSVIIGAPLAQSTLKLQSQVNETGAIYKCQLSGTCKPYIFDNMGNVNAGYNYNSYESELKDNQWLGASIDGGPEDTDKLVVCAPRLMANMGINDYTMHGICYLTPNTLNNSPLDVEKITPLRLQDNQVKAWTINERYFYHMLGEQGQSVHVTDNSEEILIGAPGIYNWRGSVILYRNKPRDRFHVMHQTEVLVPNPELWNQKAYSYFGYSVSSGSFMGTKRKNIFYIASAPRANKRNGEAYIFDIVRASSKENEYTIKKYYTFRENYFGEYFGYAVLAEDINGDGLTDVIISAPLYSSPGYIEQGAIYVYINRGRFMFKLQKKIISPIKGRGRFGSTISKLGDINHDGYNDIAVGAPFADNGAVFIYFGSSKGLHEVYSQKLEAVPVLNSWGSQFMFGHGLSRGTDIDNNGFNDFAIGAPNTESVYVYRAYPVVKILATISSLSREITPDQTKFQINICYMILTTSNLIKQQDLALRVNVDAQVKRVSLQQTNSGIMVFNVTALIQNQCRLLNANVKFSAADVFKPIELVMHYELVNGVPNSEEFCNKCAAVDPAEPKISEEKIIFSTGCKSDVCIADLSVTSSGLTPTYILGSSKTINVTYDVSNSGENAYLPQIQITSSNKIPFAKIPSSCNQYEDVLLCDLNRGQLMALGSRNNITIVYDISQIEETSITLTAKVFSTGRELDPTNNVVKDFITLQEFTEIEVIGKPLTSDINLEEVFNTVEIINNYEIKSNGPSRIQELEIAFEIPIAYILHGSSETTPIIDINNITVQGFYDQQLLPVELYQNKTLLLADPLETSTTSTATLLPQNGNGKIYHSPKLSSIDLETNSDKPYSAEIAPENEYANMAQKELLNLLSEEHMGNLPINRTIPFSCIDPEKTICVRAILKVYNFLPNIPVNIILKYHVDLKKVNEILIKPWEFFVIITKLDIVKVGDEDGDTTRITKKIKYNVISKPQLYSTPIWVIILSSLGGLLVLGAIIYGMHKAGFFRRKTKEEMEKLVQERQQATKEAVDKFIQEQEQDDENADETDYAEIVDDAKYTEYTSFCLGDNAKIS